MRTRKRSDEVEKKKFLRDLKIKTGCSVCGYNRCSDALEYDHIDRIKKNFKLSKAHNYAWERIHEELKNCVVMCANCHREKTTKEKDYLEAGWVEEESPQFSLL